MKYNTVEKFLKDFDWNYIFENFVNITQNGESPLHEPLKDIIIYQKDVKKILYLSNGANDYDAWLGVFKLKNGFFLMVRAWCDSSGWG